MKRVVGRVLAIAVLVVTVAACQATSEAKIRGLIDKWQENDFSTILAAVFGTSTGDAGQDAVIQGVTESEKQDDVTQQAREAQANNDVTALEDLIAANPGDYGLLLMRGTMALATGDTGEFVRQYSSVDNRGQDTVIKNKIVELRLIGPQVEGRWVSANQCDEYYGTLAQLHRQRYEVNHKQFDLDEAARYDGLHTQTCASIPR